MSINIDSIVTDNARDDNLTKFGQAVLIDRYLLPGENFQTLFARVASYYADNQEHGQRLYDYMSNLWFMPATPILSNGGTKRGLPISCFLNETEDSLNGIVDLWNENVWLAARGGGIGSYWGNLRAIGETVRGNGKTSGVVPFIRVQDSLTLAISQGSLRRGSSAVYLPVWHPEIEEFIDLRRPTGGDPNRKALNIHHGIVIPDSFMQAVAKNDIWELRSPKDFSVISIMNARDLWVKILTARLETGEPYLLFIDNVNNNLPESYKRLGLQVKTSNLCSEITLATGYDQHNKSRTAVCCLSSVNLEKYDDWHDHPQFLDDIMRMLDNVLQDFIDTAPESMKRAAYSAARERSVGLGAMGFHSFLQAKSIPMESVMAKVWNKKIFQHIRQEVDKSSERLAEERGPCLDAEETGLMERFTHKLSIAPTASISIICGNSSPGVEPYAANSFTQKTLTGSFVVRNKNLKKLLAEKGKDNDDTWSSIATHEGSVQQLDFLSQEEKDIYKTSVEVDQRWLIEHAADRTPYICQAQSINVFLPGNVTKKELHDVHFLAWEKGVKSLYYCRSTSIQRAEKISHAVPEMAGMKENKEQEELSYKKNKYDECLACQ
jgi:ribonucleoside-diphosphate reductase alpha chain